MGIIIGIIAGIIGSIGITIAGIMLFDSWDYELLGLLLLMLGIGLLIFMICIGISLMGVKGDNRELFLKMQQEYKVINQYIISDKSDSILESQDMMNRIKEYNDILIKKQNNMTRPILKNWTVGADWNELQLIDLENKGE